MALSDLSFMIFYTWISSLLGLWLYIFDVTDHDNDYLTFRVIDLLNLFKLGSIRNGTWFQGFTIAVFNALSCLYRFYFLVTHKTSSELESFVFISMSSSCIWVRKTLLKILYNSYSSWFHFTRCLWMSKG